MRIILFNYEKDKEYLQFDITILSITIWKWNFSRSLFSYMRDFHEIRIYFLFFYWSNEEKIYIRKLKNEED